MKKLLLTISLFCCWATSFAQDKITVSDMTKIKQVLDINTSPDGKRAVYTLQDIIPDEANKGEFIYQRQLYLTDFQTVKQLTRNANATQPAWSPDEKSLAFVRAVKDKPQIFIMPIEGGEAVQLTSLSYGAGNPTWSPDGKRIAFSVNLSMAELLKDTILNPLKKTPSWSMEKPGFKNNDFLKPDAKIKPNPDGTLEEIRAYLKKDEEDKKAKVFNRLQFQGEATTQPEMAFNHLMVIEVKEGAKPMALTTGFWNYNITKWTTNGIWASCGADTTKHPDREQNNALITINPDNKQVTRVIQQKDWSWNNASPSPDGKLLAYTGQLSTGLGYSRLYLANANGSQPTAIDFDRGMGGLTWSEDGQSLYFTAQSNGGIPVYRLNIKTKKVEQLSDFEAGVTSFDLAKDKIIFAKTEVANPSELYVADLNMKNAVKLSNHNDWLKGKALSFPEKYIYTNTKGQKVEYWIMRPTNFVVGKKHPLLLNMHGGPTAMWGPGEQSMWHEHQYFCSQGYGVVYANPRGSGGYGKDFQNANFQDWGTGPAEDVLAACTAASKQAWVDTSKQVITGGSYAGYLTAWIVGHDNRFKAAFAQRGVYDLTTFMGEGNAWRLTPSYFGLPWDDKAKAIIDRESPYSYVDKIKTPLLIKHGENDLRTGVIGSEMMYKSLKFMGKEVEYVRMPGATHELSRSGNVRQRIDRMLRIYEFFARYVR